MRSRPSTSSAGVISTITFLRIASMNGDSLDRQAVGQLHQHLGRTGLGRMDRTRRPVERLALADQSLRFGVVDLRGSASLAVISL